MYRSCTSMNFQLDQSYLISHPFLPEKIKGRIVGLSEYGPWILVATEKNQLLLNLGDNYPFNICDSIYYLDQCLIIKYNYNFSTWCFGIKFQQFHFFWLNWQKTDNTDAPGFTWYPKWE